MRGGGEWMWGTIIICENVEFSKMCISVMLLLIKKYYNRPTPTHLVRSACSLRRLRRGKIHRNHTKRRTPRKPTLPACTHEITCYKSLEKESYVVFRVCWDQNYAFLIDPRPPYHVRHIDGGIEAEFGGGGDGVEKTKIGCFEGPLRAWNGPGGEGCSSKTYLV